MIVYGHAEIGVGDAAWADAAAPMPKKSTRAKKPSQVVALLVIMISSMIAVMRRSGLFGAGSAWKVFDREIAPRDTFGIP